MLLKIGSRGPDVQRLQEGLAAFGFNPGAADGIFGDKTHDALDDWQADPKVKLYPDGVFGRGSLKKWNAYCDKYGFTDYKFVEATPAADPADDGKYLKWVRLPTDKYGSGYKTTTLRSDTAVPFTRLTEEVHARGGIITSAGGKRGLGSKASPARSKKSFHYTGRAFDLALPSGMQNVDKDPFIIVRDPTGNGRKWVVWCKVLDESAPLAGDIETVTLKAAYCVSKKNAKGKRYTQIKYKEWTGKAFSFTELAADLGFQRISGRKSFFKGGSYGGSEWWHFQWTEGLVKGQTTFGSELLKVYPLSKCKKFVYWDEAKNAVFGVSWF